MRKVSDETRTRLHEDDFMKQCCVCGSKQVQWHHNFIFGRKQSDEWWSILPLCVTHHSKANEVETRRYLDHIMLERAPTADLAKYSKVQNLIQRRGFLRNYFKRIPWQRKT